jgi:hypothetical protein
MIEDTTITNGGDSVASSPSWQQAYNDAFFTGLIAPSDTSPGGAAPQQLPVMITTAKAPSSASAMIFFTAISLAVLWAVNAKPAHRA